MKPRRNLALAAFLLLAAGLSARQTVVLDRNDVRSADAGGQDLPADPAKAAFLAAALKDFAGGAPFDATLTLINPPAWGRVVSPETTGAVGIRRAFAGGFVFHLDLAHLLPSHRYILTLNGNPQRAGNGYLADPVPGNPNERYYDFFIATTDGAGAYHGDFAVLLHPGDYDIRFYVKDTADFKIVLYHDFFRIKAL
jgi:hypothetical protein